MHEQLVIPGCERTMRFAGFSNLNEARKHRKRHGGWIFQPEGDGEVYWFSLDYTPTKIMLHPLLNGRSGALL